MSNGWDSESAPSLTPSDWQSVVSLIGELTNGVDVIVSFPADVFGQSVRCEGRLSRLESREVEGAIVAGAVVDLGDAESVWVGIGSLCVEGIN